MATEQLYRMGAGGILEAVQPEGRGRAEAMRTFLARGGGLTKLGRYRSGPMKGKTVQEATTMFENRWAGASGEVKDKYAARARDILSPSEKREAGIGTPAPPKTAAKMYADQKASRMAYYSKINGVQPTPAQKGPAPSIKKAEPKSGGDLSAQAMGTPEQQAQVRAMMGENSDLATAFNAPTGSGGVGTAVDVMAAMAAGNRESARNMAVQSGVATPDQVASARAQDAAKQAAIDARNTNDQLAMKAREDSILKGTAGISTPSPTAASSPQQQASPAVAKMPTAGTPVTNGMPTDERMHAQGKTNAGTNPVVKAPPTPPQIAGVNPAPKINRLTGMPFGAMPGETAGMNPGQIATAKTMADQRASQGTPTATPRDIAGATRMMQADGVVRKPQIAGVTPAPRPVSMSRPDGYQATSQRQDWDRENASAAARASAKIANPSDPKKFFTGRTLPLDQLVKRQKLQGIGTPARQ
ncbi:MAG: hypothetical protein E6R03_02475 [Hyphomicrobiaceae bacterium]|nr:MAG: hypothetical protein E6R03_02475 [Hyphomicrobiaceae bacterium]